MSNPMSELASHDLRKAREEREKNNKFRYVQKSEGVDYELDKYLVDVYGLDYAIKNYKMKRGIK